jgi:hypothetical protein
VNVLLRDHDIFATRTQRFSRKVKLNVLLTQGHLCPCLGKPGRLELWNRG